MSNDAVIISCCGSNLASLKFAFERLDFDLPLSDDPERVRKASHVVLPGVGAARDAMDRLQQAGLAEVIPALQQPVLGICLGMQLLFAGSEEDDVSCLGIIAAKVTRLAPQGNLPVPEMGWNRLELRGESALLRTVQDGSYAYFVHSYAAPIGDYTRASSDYGGSFSAVVERGNFFGTQFHPERSSSLGATILANFLSL